MATTAGLISVVSKTATTATLSSAAATAGTGPYTYQWYRSTTSGFTPGGGNILTGKTSLDIVDSGLTPGTVYYYKVIATDSGAVAGTSAQATVTSDAATQSLNQFSQSPVLGMIDLLISPNTVSVQFDPAGTGTLVAGQAVKFSTPAAGIPLVVPCTAEADVVAGFVNFNPKDRLYNPSDKLEISMRGNVMYLYAALAVTRGAQVTSRPSAVAGGTHGGVIPAVGSGGIPKVGFALDTAAIGQLFRVFLETPAYIVS